MTAVSKETQHKVYTAVMRAYAVKEMPLESLDVALAASRVGVHVGDAGWCTLLNTWAGVGDLDMVLSVLHQMSAIGAETTHIHWTIAVKAACRSGEAKACTRALTIMKDNIVAGRSVLQHNNLRCPENT